MLSDHWNLRDFDLNNTVIIDDLPEVRESQPSNCILIEPFELLSGIDDRDLVRVEKILSESLSYSK